MIITIIAFIVALFFAMNIGASGAAASMGIAYGSGAIKVRKLALAVCAVGVFLGASLGGGEVAKTLGSKIIPEDIISIHIALVILAAAAISLFLANLAGIPLSTSEVTVGAIVGVGIAFKALFVKTLIVVVMYWIIVPVVAFFLAVAANKMIRRIEGRWTFLAFGRWPKILAAFVIAAGFLEAFSAGMNNVANSVGPLIASGMMTIGQGTLIGGIFVALGVLLLGGKVMETNGKKITELNLLQGGTVSSIGAVLVIFASLFGIPIPHTQVTTCSILGIGMSDKGWRIFEKAVITKLLKIWVVSPFFSLVISYNLVIVFLDFDFYSLGLVCCVFVATIGMIGLWKPIRKSKEVYPEKPALKKVEGAPYE
ncbi:inorganic phosphate transporter [Sediminibacillus massiliensis]|uniref:inorganic phosphate transporter n=1 Tax=Sediminibacillus massiliensis TaxID=1926277 RepID=UPI0009886F55|nr:inorganic phosphate transporter [Sediminibacillus massiliensis]